MENRRGPSDANGSNSSLSLSSRDGSGFDSSGDWQQGLGREHVVALKPSPEEFPFATGQQRSLFPDGASSGSDSDRGHGGGLCVTPKKVYSRLSKNNAYIGFFHYAPRRVLVVIRCDYRYSVHKSRCMGEFSAFFRSAVDVEVNDSGQLL